MQEGVKITHMHILCLLLFLTLPILANNAQDITNITCAENCERCQFSRIECSKTIEKNLSTICENLSPNDCYLIWIDTTTQCNKICALS